MRLCHLYKLQTIIERTTIAVQRLPPEGHYCLFWPFLPEVDPAWLLARSLPAIGQNDGVRLGLDMVPRNVK